MLQSRNPLGPQASHFIPSSLARIGLLVYLHDFVVAFRWTVETDLDQFDCFIVVIPLLVCILQLRCPWTSLYTSQHSLQLTGLHEEAV